VRTIADRVRTPGSDAWAFLAYDGRPLTPYLAWLHYETQQLRSWTRLNWDGWNEARRQRKTAIVAGANKPGAG
jgi:hypothetical protein